MKKKTLFNLVLWDFYYVDIFLKYSLPSMLAKNNLPKLKLTSKCLFQIITSKHDQVLIEKAKPFLTLKNIVNVEFIDIEKFKSKNKSLETNKYTLMTLGQCFAIKQKKDFDYIFWFYADFIWPNGALANAQDRLIEGKDAVLSPGPICETSKFITNIDKQKYFKNKKTILEISSYELVKNTFKSLHPISKNNLASNNEISITPSYKIWELVNNNYVMHNFHLHLVCQNTKVLIEKNINNFQGSLDGDLVPLLFESLLDIHITQTSEDVFFISLAEYYIQNLTNNKNNPKNTAVWGETHLRHIHKLFYEKLIFLKSSKKITNIDKLKIEKINQFISETCKYLHMSDTLLFTYNYNAFVGRMQKLFSLLVVNNLDFIIKDITDRLQNIGMLNNPNKIKQHSYFKKIKQIIKNFILKN